MTRTTIAVLLVLASIAMASGAVYLVRKYNRGTQPAETA